MYIVTTIIYVSYTTKPFRRTFCSVLWYFASCQCFLPLKTFLLNILMKYTPVYCTTLFQLVDYKLGIIRYSSI